MENGILSNGMAPEYDKPGRFGTIGREEIKKAEKTLHEYAECKKNLEERIIENEQWWKLRHWEQLRSKSNNKQDPEPVSAWLFNSIINKHADFMDNYPEANVLPREESDKETAKILSDIVPYVLEQNGYEQTYSDETWYKLKAGTGVYGVFWNQSKEGGIGDIDIKRCDLLKLFWESGITDIQDSRNVFSLELVDNDILESQYPFLTGKMSSGSALTEIAKYIYDDKVSTDGKTVVVDWYYKKTIQDSENEYGLPVTKTVLHYCKFCNGEVLYASENDPAMENGWYEHGKYPFVFDVMFPEEGTPAGFGYIDIMKDCQMYIDKMGQAILKNAYLGAKPRYLSKDGAGINEEEFTDLSKDIIHYNGDPSSIKPIENPQLSSIYVEVMNNKIEELKETSGNRDFSQGSTTSGVTAASAIAALQEAGSKLSRDMIKSTYRSFSDVVYLVIELIRQFYTVPRAFRITNDSGMMQFITMDNSSIRPEPAGNDFGVVTGGRQPYFDITVTAQRSSPFTKIAQNELAKEMYNLGFFNPQLSDQALLCMGMMQFDGKEEIERKIRENGTMYQQLQQMQATMAQMAQVIAKTTGDTRLIDALGQQAGMAAPLAQVSGQQEQVETDTLGNLKNKELNSTAGKARERAASAATPKV
ncbi:portal protein [[Clostridium] symbiosum]|uniref:portal protein n=1 Tax=Clostridium symbiosum TaxID=1512 RepID=UPI0034A5484E